MIEITRKCNLHCRDCYHVDGTDLIDLDKFNTLIANIAEAYQKAGEQLPVLCPWFWSEPMMVPKIETYLMLASSYGYSINLTTNGTIGLEKVLIPAVNYHLLVFSVDGLYGKTYEAIRGADLDRVQYTIDRACHIIKKLNLDVPICIKLTRKGIEWAECLEFVATHLKNPLVKMVSISDSFDDRDGPDVERYPCKYLSDFMIIQSDLTFSPCCMRWKAVQAGIGKVDINRPMESFFTPERERLRLSLSRGKAEGYCQGCTSAYTGETLKGTVNVYGKDVPFKKDFYNMFFFNPDYQGV
jgi:molybdenum cofactor biosynthesis enzyme MoaA